MSEMLQLLEKEFKTTMVNKPKPKAESTQQMMGKQMEILKKNKREMLKIKITVAEMNAIHGFLSALDEAE